MESAFLLLAEPAQLRRVCEVLLNLRGLIFGGEGASGESDFERFAEESTALKGGEKAEGLHVYSAVVDGVVVAVDCEVDLRATHCGKAGSLLLLALGDGVAHDVAGRGLAMYGEHEFVDGVVEVEQLQVRLEMEFRRATEVAEVGGGEGREVGSVEGFDVSPFEAGDVEEEFVATRRELGVCFKPRWQL